MPSLKIPFEEGMLYYATDIYYLYDRLNELNIAQDPDYLLVLIDDLCEVLDDRAAYERLLWWNRSNPHMRGRVRVPRQEMDRTVDQRKAYALASARAIIERRYAKAVVYLREESQFLPWYSLRRIVHIRKFGVLERSMNSARSRLT